MRIGDWSSDVFSSDRGINYANAQSAAKQHISFFVTAPALATTAFFRIRRGSASGSGDTLSGTIYIGNITFRRAANTDMIPADEITGPTTIRPEELRVGTEGGTRGRVRWSTEHI